ncbi:MAG: relaxase domain-containing protein [Gammaproteobacteria bacterium]|jgi:conjugative relaxase-like TrwC/TraI family protein|nr:relaxase domain-containing protein [Gammaproteobacteria bacterium]MDA8191061.1 relaxase domain-containing protein [Gammaproteobacteria bacterium]
MMTIKGLSGSSAKGIVDYLEGREMVKGEERGYYAGRGAPSAWGGSLAAELGLQGHVRAKDFKMLLEGRLPDGTCFGTDGVEKDGHRRMAVDLTFSAPKSVSEYALCQASPEMRDAILAAHDRCVARAMARIEKDVVCARYGKAGHEVVKTGSMIWAAFRHEDARPVDGKVAPQIHTHAAGLNVTRGRNGELRALDLQFGEDGVKLQGAGYRADLAQELRDLGLSLRKTEEGFELADVSDEQIEAGSPRRQQIDTDLEGKGLTRKNSTGAQRTASNLSTRESKKQATQDEQRWTWRALGRAIGLNVPDPVPPQEPLPPPGVAEALAHATDHLSERSSVIHKQSVKLQALLHGMHAGVTVDLLDKEIEHAQANGHLIDAGAGRLVTRETLEREASNLAAVSAGRGAMVPLTDEVGAEARIAAREAIERSVRPEFAFSASQRRAVIRILATDDQFIVVRGAAGAGKSTSLAAVADEARARGYRVVGTGPSQTAVDGTKDVNPDDARVLASFNVREEKDPTPRVILLDECGMVSSRDMQAFLEKVRPQDKVVFVGDDLQLAAVEAGSPMSQFMKEKVVEVVEIDEIVRQKDAGLLAVATAFAHGRNEEAVQLAAPYMTTVTVTDTDYEAAESSKADAKPVNGPLPDATRSMLNLVKTIRKKHKDIPAPSANDFKTVREWLDTHSKTELGFEAKVLAPQNVRMHAIARETAQAYLELSQGERDKTLVLAATNEMRRAINEKVKAGLQEQVPEGANTASVTVTALDKSQCTKAQLREAINYKEGMILRVPEGRGRAKKVVDWTITASDPTRNTVTARNREGEEKTFRPRELNPKETGLYTPRQLDLTVGDRVVFTENRRNDGYQNNETGTVVNVATDKVTIRKDDGKTVDLAATDMHAVDHGWAVTVHRSQGRTVDRAFVAGMASKMATAALAYVACSRERWHLRIFTDHVKSLQKSWAKVAERETAKDAVAKAAQAKETAPLEAARAAVRAGKEIGDDGTDSGGTGTGAGTGGGGQGDKTEAPEPEKMQDEAHKLPPAPPPPPVLEKEKEKERELGDSYGW